MNGKFSKQIFANNLKRLMDENGKSRRDVCEALGVSYYTFSDWVNGKKFPRIDKIELLEGYFNCDKSDLLEEKLTEETKKDSDILVDITIRLRTDKDFFSLVESLYDLDSDKINGIQEMLKALTK